MACVGAADDIRPLGVAPRLALQALAVAAVIYALPDDLRVSAVLPWWLERLLLLVGGLWFVNLVNFMDGIDWMTVAEIVPITGALVVLGLLWARWRATAIAVALALGGAMLGFAYFNRPTARLFLGDVGSLADRASVGWLLVLLAGDWPPRGRAAAAALLSGRRHAHADPPPVEGERVWQAHRTHFYQRATDRGFYRAPKSWRGSSASISRLAALAVVTVIAQTARCRHCRGRCGAALVGWLLVRLHRLRR